MILEKFKKGGKGVQASSSASPDPMGVGSGLDFSNEKKEPLGSLKMGEGILPPERSPPQNEGPTTTEKNLEKASSLLDELSREEKSGFKA